MTREEKLIGYEYRDPSLLFTALTHSSYANENNIRDNERLEFLGDSVLSVIISDYIFKKMQNVDEGDLTKFRATIVCEQGLSETAKKINLSSIVRLGHGEELTGGRKRASIISDAFEAVLASIYLDGGLQRASEWLLPLMKDLIADVLAGKKYGDYKTMLQEVIQKKNSGVVTYDVVRETGKDHNKTFEVRVLIDGVPGSRGVGKSKKDAEQHAAQRELDKMHV